MFPKGKLCLHCDYSEACLKLNKQDLRDCCWNSAYPVCSSTVGSIFQNHVWPCLRPAHTMFESEACLILLGSSFAKVHFFLVTYECGVSEAWRIYPADLVPAFLVNSHLWRAASHLQRPDKLYFQKHIASEQVMLFLRGVHQLSRT